MATCMFCITYPDIVLFSADIGNHAVRSFWCTPPPSAVISSLDQDRPTKKQKQQAGPFNWLAGEICLLKERMDEQAYVKRGEDYSPLSEAGPSTPMKKKREKSDTAPAWCPEESYIAQINELSTRVAGLESQFKKISERFKLVASGYKQELSTFVEKHCEELMGPKIDTLVKSFDEWSQKMDNDQAEIRKGLERLEFKQERSEKSIVTLNAESVQQFALFQDQLKELEAHSVEQTKPLHDSTKPLVERFVATLRQPKKDRALFYEILTSLCIMRGFKADGFLPSVLEISDIALDEYFEDDDEEREGNFTSEDLEAYCKQLWEIMKKEID